MVLGDLVFRSLWGSEKGRDTSTGLVQLTEELLTCMGLLEALWMRAVVSGVSKGPCFSEPSVGRLYSEEAQPACFLEYF